MQTARRIHRSSGKTRRHCTRSRVSRLCCSSTLRLGCVLPYQRRAMLTLLLQRALSPRAAAMFEATYGCAPVASGGVNEPKWLAEFKKRLGGTMKSFVKLSGPWDM